MNRRNQSKSRGEQNEPESTESRFSEPFDHSPENPRANNNPNSSQVHDEIADVLLVDAEAIREHQRQDRGCSIERADRDRVNPDQPSRWIVGMRDNATDRSESTTTVLRGDSHLHRVRSARFLEELPGKDGDEKTQSGGT